jgi:hypothetical protein
MSNGRSDHEINHFINIFKDPKSVLTFDRATESEMKKNEELMEHLRGIEDYCICPDNDSRH